MQYSLDRNCPELVTMLTTALVLFRGSRWGLLEIQERRFVGSDEKSRVNYKNWLQKTVYISANGAVIAYQGDSPWWDSCSRRDGTQQNSEAWVKTKTSEFHIKNWSMFNCISGKFDALTYFAQTHFLVSVMNGTESRPMQKLEIPTVAIWKCISKSKAN